MKSEIYQETRTYDTYICLHIQVQFIDEPGMFASILKPAWYCRYLSK